jgi:hypothetical protein
MNGRTLAVGAPGYTNQGGSTVGVVYLYHLNSLGDATPIGSITGELPHKSQFGISLGAADINKDNTLDLLVGAPGDNYASGNVVVYILNSAAGTIHSTQIISVPNANGLGSSVDTVGDLDGDGVGDIAVGSKIDNKNAGALVKCCTLYVHTKRVLIFSPYISSYFSHHILVFF